MPVFIFLNDSNIHDPSFWAGLDVGPNSEVDATGVSDIYDITMTADSISFANTATGDATTYTNSDLNSGSFSNFVEYLGNGGNSDISGGAELNSGGYIGGSGNDILRDDSTNFGGRLEGGSGDDTLYGGAGGNNLYGGAGNDTIYGGQGFSHVLGGAGNDTIHLNDIEGATDAGSGDDVVYAGTKNGWIEGGDGNNKLILPEGSVITSTWNEGMSGTVQRADGSTFGFDRFSEVTIACFTDGTLIRTIEGEVPIEDLSVGDMVLTLDNGYRPIRWIGRQTVPGKDRHAPVRFEAGTIGNTRRMWLSQQHRVYFEDMVCDLLFAEPDVLCAAKHLCNGASIAIDPCDRVTYHHLMFDQHEVIYAEGATTESFYPGDMVAGRDTQVYEELIGLFPELALEDHACLRMARRPLKAYEGRLFASRVIPVAQAGDPVMAAAAARH